MSLSPSTTEFRPRISPGTRLSGIYEIDEPIAFGGMGEIYKGHVVETGDPVAIKLMLPEFSGNHAALALFRKEASALHRIHHDAIVRYYVFTVEPVLKRPYLAMEFVNGRTLADILQSDGPLTFEAAHSLLRRLASGLQAAHEHDVVHRDISPDNIILPNNDVKQAKIIDFGIAKTTQHGTIIAGGFAGKFSYVSPEQLGLFGEQVTAKSDMYSLALVIAEALTGKPLDMGGSQVEVIEKRRKVPGLGAIDMRLRPLLEQMLQPDPARRPDSMAAVAAWSFGSAVPKGAAGPEKSAETKTGWARSVQRRPWAYIGGALLLLLVCAAGAVLWWRSAGKVPAEQASAESPGSKITDRTPPPVASISQKIGTYIAEYNGGSCFFITPVAITDRTAAIEGFGSSIAPFRAFDAAFQQAIGFEADIGVHQITPQQCPALGFLAGLRHKGMPAPHLDIDQDELHNGEILRGLIDHYGSGNLALVLVSDGGVVENLSGFLKPGTDAKTFQVGIERRAAIVGRQPQLLLALASKGPLRTLDVKDPVDAKQFFAQLSGELVQSRTQLSATTRYLLLTN